MLMFDWPQKTTRPVAEMFKRRREKKKQNKDLNPKQNSMGNLCKAQDGSGWIYDTPF